MAPKLVAKGRYVGRGGGGEGEYTLLARVHMLIEYWYMHISPYVTAIANSYSESHAHFL